MTFESNVDQIVTELDARLKEITRLENRVIRAVPQAVNDFPTLWVQLERVEEEIESMGTNVSGPTIQYTLIFNVLFQDRWDSDETPELNEDLKISRLGEVKDKLRIYTSYPPYWDLLWTPRTEYAQVRRDAHYVFMDAEFELRVRRSW